MMWEIFKIGSAVSLTTTASWTDDKSDEWPGTIGAIDAIGVTIMLDASSGNGAVFFPWSAVHVMELT